VPKWARNFDQCAPSASNDFSPLKRYIGSRLIGNRLSIQWIEALHDHQASWRAGFGIEVELKISVPGLPREPVGSGGGANGSKLLSAARRIARGSCAALGTLPCGGRADLPINY
jgi:hypothetical protein